MNNVDRIVRARQVASKLYSDGSDASISQLIFELSSALEASEAKCVDLEAKFANSERRAEDAESRNDFLLSEIDEIIKRERQKS